MVVVLKIKNHTIEINLKSYKYANFWNHNFIIYPWMEH
jgi:hypothetical protein